MLNRLSVLFLLLTAASSLDAAETYDDAVAEYRVGKYEDALKAAEKATEDYSADIRWWRLRLECLQTLGRYREGAEMLRVALRRHYSNGPIRVVGFDLLRNCGQPKEARDLLAELLRIASYSPWMLRSAEDRAWVGRAAMQSGVDARQVLEQFFDQARKLDPDAREVYVATGELALLKQDLAVAGETFQAGLKKFPDDADLLYGMSVAVSEDSGAASTELLEQALAKNPRHVPSLLRQAEEALSHEEYAAARLWLDKVHAINPSHPRAWALRAALGFLRHDADEERQCREWALCAWDQNPEVDHTIGAKLSAAYRFAEGAAYQRLALEADPQYLPARTQLAQDLLRLGETDEGWKLVNEVQQADGYNVVAFNLATLHDHLTNYTTLESPNFLLHMERREAAVYGGLVMDLLERARVTLGKKYGWEQPGRVTVEILTNQKDFAIRTFGLPGGDGILGVCFGKVITANSPAALRGHATNWQATLWHEYTHVVTLEMTQHRIPRWLSEGISVFEERQANSTWGNRLNREIREMILAGEMSPVSTLNQAFRRPKSPRHFNLAYYEASLVVEFLVQRFGHDTLRRVLDDVTAGMPINESLERRVGSLKEFEAAFDKHAKQVATAFGEKVDWSEKKSLPPLPNGPSTAITEWLKERPAHFLGRLRLAQALLAEKKPDEAIKILEALIADAPRWSGDDSPYSLLAAIHRQQKANSEERKTLEASAAISDAALETYRRLLELASAEKDWPAVAKNVERYLAVQPLDELPYRLAAEAGEQGAERTRAIAAAKALLALDPPDRAGAHFQLAKLLHAAGDPAAKRHVLEALEETPRFTAAQQLLLKIVEKP